MQASQLALPVCGTLTTDSHAERLGSSLHPRFQGGDLSWSKVDHIPWDVKPVLCSNLWPDGLDELCLTDSWELLNGRWSEGDRGIMRRDRGWSTKGLGRFCRKADQLQIRDRNAMALSKIADHPQEAARSLIEWLQSGKQFIWADSHEV